MEIPKLYGWLVVFFVHEIAEDMPEAKDLYTSIQEAGCGPDNLVFLIKDAISLNKSSRTFMYTLSLSRLEKMADTGKFQFMPVPDFKCDNMDKDCWREAFQYIYQNYCSERKLLVTFSHGAAFGINRDSPGSRRTGTEAATVQEGAAGVGDVTEIYKSRYVLIRKDMDQLTAEGWRSAGDTVYTGPSNSGMVVLEKDPSDPVCKSLEILWISDLAGALQDCLGHSFIDIMLMVNCYMQLFDNGYLLSEKVRYLIAPEGEMWANGYDYTKLMDRLNGGASVSVRELVRNIVKDYEIMYKENGMEEHLQKTTLFANELKYYDFALKGFELFTEEIRAEMKRSDQSFDKLRDIRENEVRTVSGSDAYPLIDAGLWVRLVAEKLGGLDEMGEFRKWFHRLHQKMVVAKFVGSTLIAYDHSASQQYGYSGISIYYPSKPQQVDDGEVARCAVFDKSITSKYNNRLKWSEFLNDYFRLLRSRTATMATSSNNGTISSNDGTTSSGDHSNPPVLGGILFPPPSAGIAADVPAPESVSTSAG